MDNEKQQHVDTVVIPVGGYGTRLGETTKAVPKALLPVGDKPLIVHAIDEAIEAGIKNIIIPCRPDDVALFKRQFEPDEGRDDIIKQNDRNHLLDTKISDGSGVSIEIVAVYDKMGPASTIAKLAEDRQLGAFAVILPDDLLVTSPSAMKQMVDMFNESGLTTVGSRLTSLTKENPKNSTFIKTELHENGNHVTTSVQIKPADESPISKEATCGRYIFDENYVQAVKDCDTTGMKEVSMSAIVRHYAKTAPVGVVPFNDAKFFDCGDREGYMRAQGAFMPPNLLRELFLKAHDNVSIIDRNKKPDVVKDPVIDVVSKPSKVADAHIEPDQDLDGMHPA